MTYDGSRARGISIPLLKASANMRQICTVDNYARGFSELTAQLLSTLPDFQRDNYS